MIDTFAANVARYAAQLAAEQDAEDELAAEDAALDARVWRLTERAIAEMDQERREQLVWWVRGGGPTVAEVDAHGGPFSAAELRERWQRSR